MDKAFVTLLTTPSYLPGVLVLLHSLIALHPAPRDFKIVCLVTPETVDAKTIGEVRKAGFDLVIGVEPIGSGIKGQDALGLMGRPDLNLALTKLHLFRLSPLFHTIIYLDADVLPLRPLSHLFESTHPHILSACPDTGWPDCFNSGVMVIRPREADFEGMRGLLKAAAEAETASGGSGNGSFDGADQGLFNEWFSEEGGGGDWNRLSFTYNVTPSAAYQYAPAYKRYGHKISAVHFIGASKPWSNILYRPAGISNVQGKDGVFDYPSLIDRWYAIYDAHVRPSSAHAPDVASRFTVPETLAIWNKSTPTGGIPTQPSDRMDLDALKAATEYGFAGVNSGTYTSLPLDGRVDLMMPKPEPKPASSKRVSFKDGEGLAQIAHIKNVDALAHTPASPTIHHSPATPSSPITHHQPQAPPQSTWDAAHYSPPKEGRPEMDNAQISYYQNAWDQPASQQSSYFPAQAEKSEPQYPTLPANVRNDNWYSHFTSGPQPDRSAITAVFPWEENKDQRRPDRVFPRGSTPPPSAQQSSKHLEVKPTLVVQQPTPPGPTPAISAYSPPAPSQPMSLSEAMASYRNAWDSDPSIQKYISKITGVSQPERESRSIEKGLQSVPATPRISPEELTERRELGLNVHSHHETRSDASGDGDDEDDGDDDDDEEEGTGRRSAGRNRGNGNPRYRDNAVQTDKTEMNDVGAQWAGSTGLSPVVRTFDIRQNRDRDTDPRLQPSSTGRDNGGLSTPTPSAGAGDGVNRRGSSTSGSDSTISSLPPKPRRIPFPVSQPSTDRIPRRTSQTSAIAFTSTLSSAQSPTTSTFSLGGYETGPPNVSQAGLTGPGPKPSPLSSRRESFNTSTPPSSGSGRRFPPPAHIRRGSESVESDAITANGEPKTRASRMFDPSTDVDVRKRDTQEVLSRFMRGANAAGNGSASKRA